MYGLNDVTLAGALARRSELSYTPNGTAILRFTVAGEERIITSSGEVKRLPFYHAVKLIGPRAEELALEELKPGTGMLVTGKLEFSSWQDAQGDKKSRLEVIGLRASETVAGEVIADNGGGRRASSGVNLVRIGGNLTRDMELRHTPSGAAVSSLTVALNESYKKGKQFFEKTHFVDATLWGALAEKNASLVKGAGVFIVGRLVTDAWTDRDGNKRSSLKVEALHLEALIRKTKPTTRLDPKRMERQEPVSA